MKYTPEHIKALHPNQILVFGSNVEGRHGAGVARFAMSYGAVYGQAKGLQGQTYAIPTIDLRKGQRSVALVNIYMNIICLYRHAKRTPELEFLVTKIGTGLAGYSITQIAELFFKAEKFRPENVVLPKEFYESERVQNSNAI